MMVRKGSILKRLREEEAEANTAASYDPDAQVPHPYFAVFYFAFLLLYAINHVKLPLKFS